MRKIEAELAEFEKLYEEGILASYEFNDAVVNLLGDKDCESYDLQSALTADAISRVVGAMSVMHSGAISGGPIVVVNSSAEVYDRSSQIPRYVALGKKWQQAGWIVLRVSEDGTQRWFPVESNSND